MRSSFRVQHAVALVFKCTNDNSFVPRGRVGEWTRERRKSATEGKTHRRISHSLMQPGAPPPTPAMQELPHNKCNSKWWNSSSYIPHPIIHTIYRILASNPLDPCLSGCLSACLCNEASFPSFLLWRDALHAKLRKWKARSPHSSIRFVLRVLHISFLHCIYSWMWLHCKSALFQSPILPRGGDTLPE